MDLGKLFILRVDPGEDVLESVRRFSQAAEVPQAVVLGGYGTLAAYHLHWVTHNRIPTDNTYRRGEGGFEILGMNGLIVDGEPHVHVSLSTPDGAFGGHLESGCTAYVLCEVFLAPVTGIKLARLRVPVAVPNMGEGSISQLIFESEGEPDTH